MAINRMLLNEIHSRQFEAVETSIQQLKNYAFFRQTPLPLLDDIMNRIRILCQHTMHYMSPQINNHVNRIMQFTLSNLVSITGVPWAQVNEKLHLLAINLNQRFRDFALMMRQHANRVREQELKRQQKNLRKKKLPTPEIQVVTKSEFNKSLSDVCGICLEPHLMKESFTCNCSHSFGQKCFKTWFETCKKNTKDLNCPTCRQNVNGLIQYKTKMPVKKDKKD